MVGQTRGPSRPNMAPPRNFYPTSPPPSEQGRGGASVPPDPEAPDVISNESTVAEDELNAASGSEASAQKPSTNPTPTHGNQKGLESSQTNVKILNSEVPQYVKKMPQITNNQVLSILPSGKTVENVKQSDKSESHSGGATKRNENQPNFITMQQKINEKLLANQIPIQRLPEQQFILKQVGSSDNIVTMTTAKITESNQNYFAMLTNKPQPNYLNYLSLPVNQQNFIAVEQQQKNNIVVMEAQPKTNFVTVPQKSNVQSSGQAYLVHGNGADLKQFNSYLAVTTKPGETNGTTFFTMTPSKHGSGAQTAYLMTPKQSENSRTFVAVTQKPSEATYLALPAGKTTENNKTATFIAMEPNKSDTNIIVTQVLPSSQQSPQVFQLEYAENESGKTGKYYNSRDNAVMQSVVPKLSCSTISSGSVMSTKTAITNTLPPLTSVSSVTTTKRSTTTSKALTPGSVSPGKSSIPPLATSGNISFVSSSGNVTFLSSPNVQSLAGSNLASPAINSSNENRWSAEPEGKPDANPSSQESNSSPSNISAPVPVNSVLTSNVPHSHQYLIPNVDNLKLAAESINKMIPSQSNPTQQGKSPGILKAHPTDQNFQMHNYSKNESSSYPNHSSKSNLQDNTRRKYGQLENNKISSKNVVKYSHNIYSNHQRSDKNQNYGSYKPRVVETRPTNHQRISDGKNPEIVKPGKNFNSLDYAKKEVKEESGDIDVEGTKTKKLEDEDEEEGVEVRPVFDLRIPLVFQVVLTDHCYGMPMLLLRDEKPVPVEDDKESVLSSDGKGEDGEETETAAEGEDSITRCICDLEHDDGYMVCCDKCSVWQHVACVFPDVRIGTPLPEEYLCDACHPRKLDRNRARALQLQRRKQIFNTSDSSDSSSSSLEIAPRTKDSGPKKTVARRRAEPIQRKPVKVGKLDQSHNDGAVKNSITKARKKEGNLKTSPTVGRRNKLKKKLDSRMPRKIVRRKSKNKELPKNEKDFNSSSGSNNNNNNYHQKERSERVEGSEDSSRKSPDLRTRLQMLKGTKMKELSVKASSRVRCRMSHLPQGEPILVTSCSLSRGQLIVEIRGKFLLSDEQPGKSDCLFFYRFPKDGSEIVVDGTGHENLARYARRSCHPNSQMKHCIVKGSLRLYLIASEDLGKNQEITIAHNSISDTVSQKEGCLCRNKECPFFLPKNTQNTTEKRRRGRRRTISEESEGSPVKNKKEKSGIEPVRRNSSITQSRSPSSPIQAEPPRDKEKDRKLTRDERKIEQAMKIFAQMERDTARKKDKDRPQMPMTSNRKDSHISSKADSDKESPVESNKSRRRRRRRRRRSSRKSRLSSTASSTLTQFNSGDSDISSGDELPSPRRKASSSKDSRDEELQSPIDKMSSPRGRRDSCSSISREKEKRNDAAGLLLALGNRFLPGQKTPTREKESENEGSPPTPLSSACLLVAAAVGPLAPGFRFPKTKKGLMNEWLSKSPEHSTQDFSPTLEALPPNAQSEATLPPGAPKLSNLSNRLFNFPLDSKSLDLKETVKDSRVPVDGKVPTGTPAGFGKKRWLRQAISEECDAPQGQGSPPCPPENITPLKKRRLARESLSSDPPTTPPMPSITTQSKDDRIYGGDLNSPDSPNIIDPESEVSLAERVDELRREYLEAQERNLLKTYGRYENECVTRSEKDDEEFEKFNAFNTSPQRVPENLSYKLQDAEVAQQQGATTERPLDLTGEREKESSDMDTENEKVESSPRLPKRGRGRKVGNKKVDNEVRTSPRFRKSVAKNKKGENIAKVPPKEEGKGTEANVPNGETPQELKSECFAPVEKIVDPRLKSKPGQPLINDQIEKAEPEIVENSQEVKNELDTVEITSRSNPKPERTEKISEPLSKDETEVFVKPEVVNFKKEDFNDVTDIKEEELDEKIVQNGLENLKAEEIRNKECEGFCLPETVKDSGTGSDSFVKSEPPPENPTAELKNEEGDQYSAVPVDKIAPIKRKLSITEYLKRKKSVSSSGSKSLSSTPVPEEESSAAASPHEGTSPLASSPSDEDRSRLPLPAPSLPPVFFDADKNLEKPGSGVRFKSEPTELERQRENLTERLRREFGLLISDDEPKPTKLDSEDTMPPPPPPSCPYPAYPPDAADYLDPLAKRSSLYHPATQTLPQSAIYPVGSSNPPNPCTFTSPYSPIPSVPPPPSHDDKRKERKSKKFRQ